MSNERERFRLSEFDEFMSDDESNGHRLAKFLQSKRGKTFPKRVFDEPQNRFSLDVHVEPLGSEADVAADDAAAVSPEKTQAPAEVPLAAAEGEENIAEAAAAAAAVNVETESPPRSSKSARPRLSTLRKSGGITSSADRLRRYSLKRASALNSGRRTLLKEFENTMNTLDFMPPICSTPCTTPSTTTTNEAACENNPPQQLPTPESDAHPPSSPINSSHSSQLMQQLQLKDEEMRAMLENVVETSLRKVHEEQQAELERSRRAEQAAQTAPPQRTPPPKRQSGAAQNHRSYTVEKGPIPGQVLLTPTRRPSSAAAAAASSSVHDLSPVGRRPSLHCNRTFAPTSPLGSINVKSPEKLLAQPRIVSEFKREYGLSASKPATSTLKKKPSHIPRRKVTCDSVRKASTAPSSIQTETFIAATQEMAMGDGVAEMSEEEEDIEIPETQELPLTAETQRQVQSAVKQRLRHTQQSPIIVMPLTQTFNGTQPPESMVVTIVPKENGTFTIQQKNETTRMSEAAAPVDYQKQIANATPSTTTAQKQIDGAKANTLFVSEDDLRLTDILTDDDEDDKNTEEQKKRSELEQQQSTAVVAETSSVPLDLVSSGTRTTRARRLRKRSTKRRRLTADLSLVSTETETEMGPPRAHPLNLRRSGRESSTRASRRHLPPLNKAPSSPINGEKFAVELKTQLERLSNREILDLRKDNSLGKVFPAPVALRGANGRRKSLAQQQLAIDKRLQLEEEIQLEILKRNLQGNDEELELHVPESTATPTASPTYMDEGIYAECTPAPPDAFKDNTAAAACPDPCAASNTLLLSPEEQALRQVMASENASLLDGGSGDCVTFTQPQSLSQQTSSSRRDNKQKQNQMPEMVRQYLDITTKINKKKKSKNSNTKRSLYTKGNSDSEGTATNLSPESENRRRRSNGSTNDEEATSSSTSALSPLPVVPPPPSFLNPTAHDLPDLHVVSPPPPMEKATPSRRRRSSKRVSQEAPSPLVSEATASETDAVFKKPAKPAPRSRARKRQGPPESSETSTTPPELDNSLRRSKRGHVPLKNASDPTYIFSIMFNEQLQKSEESRQKRLKRLMELEKAALAEGKQRKQPPQPKQHGGGGDTLPIASSTANSYSAAASTQKATKTKKNIRNQKQKPAALLPQFSLLGDTNASSATSVASSSVRALSPIYEPLPQLEQTSAVVPQSEQPRTSKKRVAPKKTETLKKKTATNAGNTISAASTCGGGDSALPPTNESTPPAAVETTFDAVPQTEQPNPPKSKKTTAEKKTAAAPKKKTTNSSNKRQEKGVLEHSHIALSQPPPLDKLNEIFDKLKRTAGTAPPSQPELQPAVKARGEQAPSSDDSTKSNKKLRVRLQRLPSNAVGNSTNASAREAPATPSPSMASNSSGGGGAGGDVELLTFLRGVTDGGSSSADNFQIFQEMHCSAAGNLLFMDLEGVDYAFYDTEDKASLGYLRFKPLQSKAARRAKKYHLHFVVLSGRFKICTNNEIGYFTTGDMVAINIGSRYTIENTSNDISLLMVIKK